MASMTELEYRDVMFDIIDQYYNAYWKSSDENVTISARQIAARPFQEKYDEIASKAIKEYPNGHCAMIDPWRFQDFSDYYKDVNGFRPRGDDWTVAKVAAWLAQDHELPEY